MTNPCDTQAHDEDNLTPEPASAELHTRAYLQALSLIPAGCTCTSPDQWITCPSGADHI